MRIAVIGGGISGLVAARRLAGDHDVTLFEREARTGGHALTVEVEEDGRRFPVDLGFLVYNRRNYPIFSRLLDELRVETAPSSMGFSVHETGTGFTFSGEGVAGLLARRRNLVDPRFWRLVGGQLRFARAAAEELRAGGDRTIGEFARASRLPEDFLRLYLLPMAGAIWSMPAGEVLGFPAASLLRFFDNHGLVTLADRPRWRTVLGGSRRYVEALVAALPAEVRTGAAVERLRRPPAGGVELRVGGGWRRFDRAVLALHSDQALELLEDPSRAEREVLGAVRFRANETVLHDDRRLLPPKRRAWASWNVRIGGPEDGIGITYLLNRLQPIPARRPWMVTLNRSAEIDPARIVHRVGFSHPQFDAAALAAQERWSEISGPRDTHYAGAWWRWGFHEDGAWSGARAAAAVESSVRRPAA